MRFPAEEHHPFVLAGGALELREHRRFTGFDDFEVFQAESVLVDHALNQAVAVVARFDAVELAVELVLEFGDVGKVVEPRVVYVVGHRQGVFGAMQVGTHGFHGAGVAVGLDVVFGGGHPVAKEHIQVLARGQGAVGHGDRQQGGFGFVSE
ncbi:hypothetical protein D3C76_462640 [compost metagenome]